MSSAPVLAVWWARLVTTPSAAARGDGVGLGAVRGDEDRRLLGQLHAGQRAVAQPDDRAVPFDVLAAQQRLEPQDVGLDLRPPRRTLARA